MPSAPRQAARANVCQPEVTGVYSTKYLAFDVRLRSPYANVSIVTGQEPCAGLELLQIWFGDYDVPEVGQWTTQCASVHSAYLNEQIAVIADDQAEVARPRFVAQCECVRSEKVRTVCGWQDHLGNGGGSGCY